MANFGEGFYVTIMLLGMATIVFTFGIWKGGTDIITTIVGIMGGAVSAACAFWLATRGQTSQPPSN